MVFLCFIKDSFRQVRVFSQNSAYILSWDISLNPGPVHGSQNENLLQVLPFHDSIFPGDGFYYNLNVHGTTTYE